MNSSARRSEKALERLEQQYAEVKTQLEELTRLVTTGSQASARPASVGDSGSTAESPTIIAPRQQGAFLRHVHDEGLKLEVTERCE